MPPGAAGGSGMESSMKPVVLEDPPDEALSCCCPGCCALPCCKLCCLPCCSLCCPRCARRCCGGCGGCGGCSGCARSCLCLLPRLLCYLPRKLLSCGRCRCLLLVVLAVLLLVIVVAGVLLLWLRAAPPSADQALERTLAWPWLPVRVRDEAASFYVDGGAAGPATVIYDYEHLLISYRSWRHPACYVARMDRDSVPGLDDATAAFERRQAERAPPEPLGDRSLLSTAADVLCGVLPVYWA